MLFNLKTDSRRIQPGDTFVAIKTIDNDGQKYIADAIKNGAVKIVCTQGSYPVETVLVADSRKWLEEYLKTAYAKCLEEMTIIGITGTNGKSTMAYLLYEALNKSGRKAAYVGTLGSYTDGGKMYKLYNTTPDICDLYEALVTAYNRGCRYFCMEVSSHSIAEGRVNTISYDYAVFTNLSHDHLDFHKTMENYAATKATIFHRLKKGGQAIVNIDDAFAPAFVIAGNQTFTYGKKEADWQIGPFTYDLSGTAFTVSHLGQDYRFKMQLIGEFNIYNMVPVIIMLADQGLTMPEIEALLPQLHNVEGRMERLAYKDNLVIVDYANTPVGMDLMIGMMKKLVKGDIYVVFGERGDRDRTKRPKMTTIATNYAKWTIVTTSHVFFEDPQQILNDLSTNIPNTNFEVIPDRRQAIAKGISLLKSQDCLLILGKGNEDYLHYGDHVVHFDDVEEAQKIIDAKLAEEAKV